MVKIAVVGDQHITGKTPRCRKDSYPDAILSKIEQILISNDIFIGLGDLFDSASIEEQTLNKFMSLLIKYKKQGKRFFTILGNHDLFKHNTNLLEKTSLGLCMLDGLVERLAIFEFGNVLFQEIPFVKKNPELPNLYSDYINVLLGHYFYENNFCPEFSLTREQLDSIQVAGTFVILGHDHAPYGVQTINNCLLVRLGSLCRNTANDYNFNRVPKYTQFTFDSNKLLESVNYVELDSIELDVFLPQVTPQQKQEVNVEYDMTSFFDKFGYKSSEEVTLTSCLQEVGTREVVVDVIKEVYTSLNMNFK